MLTAPLPGLVLAGGESRRMGRDKGRLSWNGTEQRLRTAELLSLFCSPVYISLRSAEEISGYPVLVDNLTGIGPMAGLLRAFREHPDAAWLVLACDLPLMSETALRLLVAGRDPGRVATCLCGADGRPEPLAAIWEPSALRLLQKAQADGQYGLQRLLNEGGCALINVPNVEWLHNSNTPGEWAEARLRAPGSDHS
ncbi:MAG: molybdenum cofactor guanylyltransferase [Chitinophagaceae bacterium]|nr:MAG: molybdenum cofactor guanylyltransferase [Chitinophagaceae bacterium]